MLPRAHNSSCLNCVSMNKILLLERQLIFIILIGAAQTAFALLMTALVYVCVFVCMCVGKRKACKCMDMLFMASQYVMKKVCQHAQSCLSQHYCCGLFRITVFIHTKRRLTNCTDEKLAIHGAHSMQNPGLLSIGFL